MKLFDREPLGPRPYDARHHQRIFDDEQRRYIASRQPDAPRDVPVVVGGILLVVLLAELAFGIVAFSGGWPFL